MHGACGSRCSSAPPSPRSGGGSPAARASRRSSDGSLAAVLLPTETDAPRVLGMVKAAFAPVGGFDELQEAVLGGIATSLYGLDLTDVPVADDGTVARAPQEERLHAVHLMVVLEFIEHPLSTRVEQP